MSTYPEELLRQAAVGERLLARASGLSDAHALVWRQEYDQWVAGEIHWFRTFHGADWLNFEEGTKLYVAEEDDLSTAAWHARYQAQLQTRIDNLIRLAHETSPPSPPNA